MAFFRTRPPLRLRRARAVHRRSDDGDPSRQAPRRVRHQRERRSGGHRMGPTRLWRTSSRTSAHSRPTSWARSATTPAVTTTTRSFWVSMGPGKGGEPTGALADAIASTFGLVRRLPGKAEGRGHRPLRLGLGLARAQRLGPRDRPQRPTRTTRSATVRRRCSASTSGTRVLPEVPEPPPRLPGCVVEHGQTGTQWAERFAAGS